jgi:Holliday junction resolvasome RuvABC ATP-dependent DNA helicase subunit
MMKHDIFKNVIGQDTAKRKLDFYLRGYLTTRKTPYFMFCGSKGQGKTLLAKELAKGFILLDENGKPQLDTHNKPKRKTFVEINASILRSVKHLINVLLHNVQDKDVTIFIDEAHELRHDVTNALLTILSPGADTTQFVHDEYTMDIDHRRQTFIFATSESYKVFPPLMDRMQRIDLEDYTNEQMQEIVQKHTGEIDFEPQALAEIVTVLRGNARAAAKMAHDIKTFLEKKTHFSNRHWKDLSNILGINPLGLNPREISILRYLAENPDGTSLTRLAAKTGESRETIQKDYEMYLLKRGLICIETTGRQITKEGLSYLKGLSCNKN